MKRSGFCANASRLAAMIALALAGTSIATAAPPGRIAPASTGFGRSGDLMGVAAAVLGDTALVGSPKAEPNAPTSSGAVQIFRNGVTGWQLEATLVPSPPIAGESFGAVVSLGVDIAAVGAWEPAGTTHVFVRNGTHWSESDVLSYGGAPVISGDSLAIQGPDGIRVYTGGAGAWVVEADFAPDLADQFERVTGLALAGDTLAFSTIMDQPGISEGEAYEYFYRRTNGTWTRDTKRDYGTFLVDFTPAPLVALSNDSALVAFGSSVRIYVRGDGSWPLQQTLDGGVPWDVALPQSVALEGDRAVVGCPGDDVLGVPDQGSVFVFERSGNTWTRVARPYDADGASEYDFGASVALSGDDLLVGSPGAIVEGIRSGKATPIVLAGSDWTAGPALDEGSMRADIRFGTQVAASGSSIIIGAPYESIDTPITSGVAYIFESTGSGWAERARLVPPSVQYYNFPAAVAIDGDTAVASSYADSLDGGIDDLGAVYVYRRNGSDWEQEQRIGSGLTYTKFGTSVALEGDLLAIGDTGSADHDPAGRVRLFTRSGNLWTEQVLIRPQESAAGDNFGNAVSLSGTTLAVGAYRANVGIEQAAGAVYVFENVSGSWQQQARLESPNPLQNSSFGYTVAVAGDTVVVGDYAAGGQHAVYAFARDGSDWTSATTLPLPAIPTSVALSADASVAMVGIANDSTPGAAYVFRRDNGEWVQSAILHGGAFPASDTFGAAISVSGGDAFIGAPTDPVSGAVYVIGVGDAILVDGFD
jgi:FG-GAP repeat protein